MAERSAQVKEEPAQRAGDTEQSALPSSLPSELAIAQMDTGQLTE